MYRSVCVCDQVLCSQPEEYNSRGVLCDAQPEGPLRRNPGNHNRAVVPRLPTSREVDFTLGLQDYDTPPLDRTANMSFRNIMEGKEPGPLGGPAWTGLAPACC